MSKQQQTLGRCFCGAVEIQVLGEPVAMGTSDPIFNSGFERPFALLCRPL